MTHKIPAFRPRLYTAPSPAQPPENVNLSSAIAPLRGITLAHASELLVGPMADRERRDEVTELG